MRSHRESSALAPYVNLARGWNRQRDLDRNPLFYDDTLTPATYHEWLRRWAVHYRGAAGGRSGHRGGAEAKLLGTDLPYLRQVWARRQLEAVRRSRIRPRSPTPRPPWSARVPGELVLKVRSKGPVLIRIPYSPWLGLVDAEGHSVKAAAGDRGVQAPAGGRAEDVRQRQRLPDGDGGGRDR